MAAKDLAKKYVPPMLATLADEIPARADDWIYEPKLDGYRCIAAVGDGEAVLMSRNGLDLSDRFPNLVKAVLSLEIEGAVLDGEIIARDEHGEARFELIQNSSPDAVLSLFDLLQIDGEDLRGLKLEIRREKLEALFAKKVSGIELVERLDAENAVELARDGGHEGVVAKRRGSKYVGRRSPSWIKIKIMQAAEFAVVGIRPASKAQSELGALAIAVWENGRFVYAGRVGTGFTASQRKEMWQELEPLAVDTPPVDPVPGEKDMIWIEPRLVAQVRFLEWTSDGYVRHPSFAGFRIDKTPEECVREDARARRRAKTAEETVRLTNPDRLLWPRDAVRKIDLVDYYAAMQGPILAAVSGRPLALEHWNDGIDKPSWFQQDLAENLVQPWMTLVNTPARTHGRDVRHLVADSETALRWLGQHSVLTIHTWASRLSSLESPDWMLFDFDPAAGEGIAQAIEPALVLRDFLENIGLPSMPKTSGKRGLHVIVPLEAGQDWDRVASFALEVGTLIASQLSDVTVERATAKRQGRLYLDCLQNGWGKLIVAPYSPRGIDGARVSAPLDWDEVNEGLDPNEFNLRTMPDRVAKIGDLFAEGMRVKGRVPGT